MRFRHPHHGRGWRDLVDPRWVPFMSVRSRPREVARHETLHWGIRQEPDEGGSAFSVGDREDAATMARQYNANGYGREHGPWKVAATRTVTTVVVYDD